MKQIHLVRAVVLAVVAVPLGCASSLAASAEKGKSAFMKAGCWQCHGTVGQGGITGPRLAPGPIPFETFQAFVRSSSRQMPPYREQVLPDADLADIHAYLESIPKPRDYKDIPLLAQ
jgi:ubiquinol-cytochrome c reductase cytochrome c subunit